MINRMKTHIKDEKWVLRRHNLGRAIVGNFDGFLMPPVIPPLRPSNLVTRSLEHEHMLDQRTLLERGINNRFVSDRLATTSSLVGGDHKAGLAIFDAIAERFS
jgi:hypothetical protein